MGIIRTKIKFFKSTRTGNPVGFVTYKDHHFVGVREEDSCLKSVVIVPNYLVYLVELDCLYEVSITQLPKDNGYEVVELEKVLFKAEISQEIVTGKKYGVVVKYGNKKIKWAYGGVKSKSIVGLKIASSFEIADNSLVLEEFNWLVDEVSKKAQKDGFVRHKKILDRCQIYQQRAL